MKKIVLSLGIAIELFGHAGHIEMEENQSFAYGAFFNLSYRDTDLYPKGIEQANGFDNHGKPNEIVMEHIGGFVSGQVDKYVYNLEFNHHARMQWSGNNLVEKLYVGYKTDNELVKIGRDINHVSFVDTKDWGYGFIKMPLAVDSFFDKTLFGDGLFMTYTSNSFKVSTDYMNEMYTHKGRKTLKASYDFGDVQIISYVQQRDKVQSREDFSSAIHTHTHGAGCDNLSGSEMCVGNEGWLYGLGSQVTLDGYEIVGEYLSLQNSGDVRDNNYKVDHTTNVKSAYLQILSKNEKFNYGVRSEVFWYDKKLSGSGASIIANEMNIASGDENSKYLHTLNISYTIDPYQKVFFENSYSNNDNAVRVNYLFRFMQK